MNDNIAFFDHDRVLVDVDGVCAGFMQAAHYVFGEPYEHDTVRWDFWRAWSSSRHAGEPMSDLEFWEGIDCAGHDFWASLPVLEDGRRFVDLLQHRQVDFAFCSRLATVAGCHTGREEWLLRHFPDVPRVYTADKWLLAAPRVALVDDLPENVNAFREHGGHGVLWKRPWNRGGVTRRVGVNDCV